MTRVVHISTAHPWNDARILYRECRGLAEAGFDVTLVCGGDGDARMVEGVGIVEVPRSVSRLARMTVGAWRCTWRALAMHPALIHIHDAELLVPALVARARGLPVVYDVHEDLPLQVMSKGWIPSWLRPSVSWVAGLTETVLARAMSGCCAATPHIAARFGRLRPTEVVQNFPPTGEIAPRNAPEQASPETTLVYMGGLTEARGIRVLVEAVGRANRQVPVRLVLAGRFWPREYESDLSRVPGWDRVTYVGWQDRAGIDRLIAGADIGMVVLLPEPNYLEAYPTKLFEYMLGGIPVIASDFPLWREIVEAAKCGLLVDPGSPDAVASAIVSLVDDPDLTARMGAAGRAAALAHYTWESQYPHLEALYNAVLTSGTGR